MSKISQGLKLILSEAQKVIGSCSYLIRVWRTEQATSVSTRFFWGSNAALKEERSIKYIENKIYNIVCISEERQAA